MVSASETVLHGRAVFDIVESNSFSIYFTYKTRSGGLRQIAGALSSELIVVRMEAVHLRTRREIEKEAGQLGIENERNRTAETLIQLLASNRRVSPRQFP